MASVDNIAQVAQATNPSASSVAAQSLAGDFNTFLKLLTTQLQNQDPTEPVDTNEFTQQLVLFSNAEQSVKMNENLEKLIELQSGSQINNMVGYIGKYIEATGTQMELQDGAAQFAYDLSDTAEEITVSILDDQNNVVFSGSGDTKAGRNYVTWGGQNSFTLATEPDGIYKVSVIGKDSKGEEIKDIQTFTIGRVTSVDTENGDSHLTVGTLPVELDKVVSVTDAVQLQL